MIRMAYRAWQSLYQLQKGLFVSPSEKKKTFISNLVKPYGSGPALAISILVFLSPVMIASEL